MKLLKTSWFALALSVLFSFGSLGCGSGGPGTVSGPGPVVTNHAGLEVGDQFEIPGTEAHVKFDRVLTDSRCPTTVRCIWEGNARLVFSWGCPGRG